MNIEKRGTFFKVDDAAQIAYGWAIVCTENGEEYTDLQGDHIPEDVMVAAAIDFATHSRVGKDMHAGERVGECLFTYPITKSSSDLGIPTQKTGLLIGFKPDDPAMLDLIKQGQRTGFSIGGFVTESSEEPIGKTLAKSAGGEASKTRRVFRSFKISEISLVDVPAMEGAKVGYVKRAIAERVEPVAMRADSKLTHEEILKVWTSLSDEERTDLVKSSATPREKSTRGKSPSDRDLTKAKDQTMDPKDQEIASLKKTLAGLIALSSAEHAHYKTLGGDEQAVFLAKSATDRAAVITEIAKRAEEADKVVYVSKANGDVFKAKDDPRLVEMAKREDAARAEVKKAAVRKQAAEVLGGAPGDDETHDFIIEAIGSNEKAVEALKGLVATSTIGKRAPGASGSDVSESGSESETLAKFEKGLVAFAKSKDIKNVWTDARAAYLQTEEGEALNRAYLKARNA